MNASRLGKFYISSQIVFADNAAEIFQALNFVPLRAELLAATDQFEYVGISDKFDLLSPGHIVPQYELATTADEDDNLSVVVTRVQ